MKKSKSFNGLINGHSLLDYPIDSTLLLRKKHTLKRELLCKKKLITKRIAILGGSTADEVKNILELFLLNIGIKPEFYESAFNRYYEEAVFENKALMVFNPDIIYIHTTNKNITAFPQITDSNQDIETIFHQEKNKYISIWSVLSAYHCPIIQNNFELPQHRILGNLDAYDPHGALNYITRLNAFFADEAFSRSNVYLNDINYLAAELGLNKWFDNQLWHSARYALSFEAIPHLVKSIAAIIGGLLGMSKKAMILDLDNTCWGGAIGDDGVKGIIIGKETALAEAFTEFQKHAKLLKERGIILAVSSKNNLELAQEGFNHPDTVLAQDDFSAFEANWDLKYINIVKISKALNLSLDNFIFIDNDAVERQMVRESLPELTVPDIGNDVANFIDHIDKNYYFETTSVSNEDTKRTLYYQKKSASISEMNHFVDYATYLDSLEMEAEIHPFVDLYLDRITQLINKTNQFNLTNKRYSLSEIESTLHSANYISLYGRLTDRYGDNGLVSAVLGSIQGHQCHIDLWVMSCRVLQRTLENAILDSLVSQCKSMGIETIIGYYHKTAKNKLVATLFEELGFELIFKNNSCSTWNLQVSHYTNKNTHIRLKI